MGMHELSLMASVMDIVREELSRHGATRLLLMRIRYGALDQVQPDAMRMAFEVMTAKTPHEGAKLELVEDALILCCRLCSHTFRPKEKNALFMPCPACGKYAPFDIKGGEGIFLDHLEAR